MNIRTLVFAAAVGLGPAALFVPTAMAQPEWDVVHVNLPYSVQVGNKTLAPGDYTIEQLRSADSPVLLFYNGTGMKFETSAMTIPALENTDNTPDKTQVILHHIGDDYYFDKIWIQGKDYGYQFQLPTAVKAREKEMSKLSVPAQASTTTTATEASNTVASTDNNSIDVNNSSNNNSANTVAANTDTTTTTNTDTTATTTPPPPVTDNTAATTSTDVAQATTTTDNSQPAMTDNSQSTENSANREKRSNDDTNNMPATSAGWLAMLLSGGTLSSAGMMLRRKR